MKKAIFVFAFVFASTLAFANNGDTKNEDLACQFTMTSEYQGWSITRTIYCNGNPTIQSQIDQLHADVKALAERMGRLVPADRPTIN